MSGSPSLAAAPRVGDWLAFTDDAILVHTGKVEIGQRIGAALSAIAADELGVAVEQVRILPVSTRSSPDEGYTSGSNSVQHSGEALRLAAATVRAVLTARAAAHLSVPEASLTLENGEFRSPGSNDTVNLWQLADDALAGVAVDVTAPVRSPDELRVVGGAAVPAARSAMVRGSLVFVQDLQLDGMLHARVIRPPHAARTRHSTTAPRGAAAGPGRAARPGRVPGARRLLPRRCR
jgi:CO/xanthine dehydrogenase Mo-binding subunit